MNLFLRYATLTGTLTLLSLVACSTQSPKGNTNTASITAPAQEDTSSIKNPQAWLQDNINEHSSFTASVRGTNISLKAYGVKFNQCTMSYHFRSTTSSQTIFDWTYTFDLKDMDAEHMKFADDKHTYEGKYLLQLPVTSGKSKVKMKVNQQLDTVAKAASAWTDTVNFPFDDKDMAERVAKGFANAIRLCQKGKN